MNFIWLDIGLMIAFVIGVTIFLSTHKKNLKREGLLYLYKAKWGIRLINKVGTKYKKTLNVLSHVSIWLGYVLMVAMLWMVAKIVWIYLFNADIVRAIKIPPITPLVPYLPQIFKLSFLPPFYFIYWIIIIAVIAISHEFFHGIFMKLYKIKIKSTGFGFFPFFFPIFMAAFVEQDEKSMLKAKNRDQRVVLSAGTFANSLTVIIGLLLIAGFFAVSFTPSGVVFDDYAYDLVETSEITMLNNISLQNPTYKEISELIDKEDSNLFKVQDQAYRGIRGASADGSKIALYFDSPARNSDIYGPIIKVEDQTISSLEEFSAELSKFSIGQEVVLTTQVEDLQTEYSLVLQEKPGEEDSAWIGVSFFQNSNGIMTKIFMVAGFYKDPHIFYAENYQGAQFIYDFLWWLVLISFSVALVNMLPMGIFDGGRFFYLTILKLTKNENIAQKSFKYVTWFLLFIVALIMVYWAKSFF